MDKDVEIRFEALEKKVAILENLFKTKPEEIKKIMSIKEFILEKCPTNDLQRTLVLGYYFEKYRGMSSFNVKDLENGFREAKEKVPANINDKVNQNIGKGYLMGSEQKKNNSTSWLLTSSGERLVENGFKKE